MSFGGQVRTGSHDHGTSFGGQVRIGSHDHGTSFGGQVRAFNGSHVSMSVASRVFAAVVAAALSTACVTRDAPAPIARRPVLVQGAMDVEIRRLAGALDYSTE